jgi:hypothetical protein
MGTRVIPDRLARETRPKPALSPTTYHAYETRVRVYVVPRISKIPFNQLTPQHVQICKNLCFRRRAYSGIESARANSRQSTVLDTRRVLGKALGQAAKWG